jgi:hypothetical protein
VLIVLLERLLTSYRKAAAVLLAGSAGAIALVSRMLDYRLVMPILENVINKSGLGPLSLHDAEIRRLKPIDAPPDAFWVALTVISMLGASILLMALALSAWRLASKLWISGWQRPETAGAFLLLSAMVYLFPPLVGETFDRYLIPAMPFLAAGLAGVSWPAPPTATRACRFTAVALLCALGLFAVCSTRDYLAWNRIRWTALADLMESGEIGARDIDGGFEFNGWHLYDPHYKMDPQKSWWWVDRDTYRICFGGMPGYTTIKEYNYFYWLPPHPGTIVVLKKN